MRRFVHATRIASLGAAMVIAMTMASPAFASDCTMPGPAPVIPDGTAATVDQMKDAHTAVQSYVNLLQSFQDCVEARIKITSKTSKPEDLQKLRDSGNAAIDQAKALSANYAAQVKAFKARAPK
jgi:hypothetical protein